MSSNIWMRVMVATLSMAASVTVGWAQVEVSAGYDLFMTDPDTTDLLGIPFVGDTGAPPIFDFVAPPASADARRAIGDTDTIVHRLENASVPAVPGTADPIAIELVMLRLVSTIEFDVDGDGTNDGFLYVTLQKDRDPAGEERLDFDVDPPEEDVNPGLRSFGEMTITFDSAAGGTFDSELTIYADLRRGAPDGPIVCGENAGLPPCSDFDDGLVLESIDSPWARDTPPQSITIRGVNFSLAAPDRNTPVDVSSDSWAGIDPATSVVVCVNHQGHQDPGGAPTAHGTCCPPCTPDPITPNICRNGRDDNCNGLIDECAEDQFGPIVEAPDDPTFECPQIEADLGPSVTGFATGTDNCFPPTLPAGNITFADFRTDGCGETFVLDRVWMATDDCGNDASMPDLQQIHVVDTTDPDIDTCPDEATILWTDDRSPASLGTATGSDACGGVGIDFGDVSVAGICLSEEVTRTWTVTDECANESDCGQPIHVRGPRDSIEDLKDEVLALGLPKGTETALLASLNTAERKVCSGDSTAVNQLDAFIKKVKAQSGKKINSTDADELIAAAQAIIDAVDQGGTCPDGC